MSTLRNDFLERLCFHFYDDYEELRKNFRAPEVERIMRLRELDREVMQRPARPDKERVQWLRNKYGISDRQAYVDLQDLRIVVGIPTTYNKEYDRFEMMQLLRTRITAAAEREDDTAVAKLMKEYNVMARFGKDEPHKIDTGLTPLTSVPTNNLAVLDLAPLAEDERIVVDRAYKKFDKDCVDIEYEEVRPTPKDPFEASPLRIEKVPQSANE